MWNLLARVVQMIRKGNGARGSCDAAIRAARKEIERLAQLPAQASQAVLKTYLRAWANCSEPRAASQVQGQVPGPRWPSDIRRAVT